MITVGLVGGYLFGVYLQNVSGGAYLSTLTLVTGLPEVVIAIVKAATFGLIAGLVGCYRGLTVARRRQGCWAPPSTRPWCCASIALFAVNVVLTTIGVRFGTGQLTCRRPRSYALAFPRAFVNRESVRRRRRPRPRRASGRWPGSSSTAVGYDPATRCATTARRRCG